MDFAAHYYFAKKGREGLRKPFYCLGLIYPDIGDKKRKVACTDEDFQEGVEEHEALDRMFHKSQFFKDWLAEARKCSGLVLHMGIEIAADLYFGEKITADGRTELIEAGLGSTELDDFYRNYDAGAGKRVERILRYRMLRAFQRKDSGLFVLMRKIRALRERFRIKVDWRGQNLGEMLHEAGEYFQRNAELFNRAVAAAG